jgi:hypothetical protein
MSGTRAQRSIKPQKEAAPVCCLGDSPCDGVARRSAKSLRELPFFVSQAFGAIAYGSSMKTTLVSKNCLHRSLGRSALLLIPLLLACFALSPQARAVDPPPDGGYPNQNTAEGEDALFSLTSGTAANTAIGFNALYSDTTGNSNVAVGSQALFSNTTGSAETAIGWGALYSNNSGYGNSAFGGSALYNNTTGFNNTASGHSTLYSNTTGSYNVADGVAALQNANGSHNVAMGYATLYNYQRGHLARDDTEWLGDRHWGRSG